MYSRIGSREIENFLADIWDKNVAEFWIFHKNCNFGNFLFMLVHFMRFFIC